MTNRQELCKALAELLTLEAKLPDDVSEFFFTNCFYEEALRHLYEARAMLEGATLYLKEEAEKCESKK